MDEATLISASINNLERLGLIKVPTDVWITDDSKYEWATNNFIYFSLLETYADENHTLKCHNYTIIMTQFGLDFSEICLSNTVE
ncbi:MAG: DUF4393 domain-containing protein [Tissierellia bacterium]|nr:DUF4393 domain-containing protein [Tissierellia bacterium]